MRKFKGFEFSRELKETEVIFMLNAYNNILDNFIKHMITSRTVNL